MHSQSDAMEILEFYKSDKNENLNLIFNMHLHLIVKINQNIFFWCHAHCFELCQNYGDVVAFDTIYKVNSYDMSFGIFVSIDNYGRTILFGCALLRNEKLKTFRRLFKVSIILFNFFETYLPYYVITSHRKRY